MSLSVLHYAVDSAGSGLQVALIEDLMLAFPEWQHQVALNPTTKIPELVQGVHIGTGTVRALLGNGYDIVFYYNTPSWSVPTHHPQGVLPVYLNLGIRLPYFGVRTVGTIKENTAGMLLGWSTRFRPTEGNLKRLRADVLVLLGDT